MCMTEKHEKENIEVNLNDTSQIEEAYGLIPKFIDSKIRRIVESICECGERYPTCYELLTKKKGWVFVCVRNNEPIGIEYE